MKHLVHKVHHPHLKKRAYLELAGLLGLVTFVFFQRDLLNESVATVLEVEILWFVLLLACYWFLLPLTVLSYKFISPKPERLKMKVATLAHLAGAGPGRIIPGGIGNLSISALHLKKTGLTIEQSIGVVVTNNLFGLVANFVLLVAVAISRPEVIDIISSNITSRQLTIALVAVVAIVVILQWLFHARSTSKELHKTYRQWRKILVKFITHPRRVAAVFAISIIIALIHTFMLDFSAYALNVNLSITDALIALSFGVLLGGILPTPGGLGGVEAGISAALIVLGYSAGDAASIAVLFRLATYWQPLIPGTLAYLYLRERRQL